MTRAERVGYKVAYVFGRTLRFGILSAAGAAVVASGALVKLSRDSANSLDEIKAFSGQVNFSADALRTLMGVADRYNVSQGSLQAGLSSFNARLGQLKNGQGALYKSLKTTNPVLLEQMKHAKSTEQAYVLLFGALAKITDPSKRAALVKAAGVGQESLRFFADGPEGLRRSIGEVKNLQGVLGQGAYDAADDFNDKLGDLKASLIGLRDAIGSRLFPVLTPMIEQFAQFIAKSRGNWAANIVSGVQGIAKWIKDIDWSAVRTGAVGFFAALRGAAESVVSLVGAIKSMGGWPAVLAALVAYKAVGGVGGMLGGLGRVAGGAAGAASGGASGGGLSKWLLPLLKGPGLQALLYLLGREGIDRGMKALPHPAFPKGYNPDTFSPWEDLKKQLWGGPGTEDRATRAGLDPSGAKEAGLPRGVLEHRAERLLRIQKMLDHQMQRWQQTGQDKSDPGGFVALASRRIGVANQLFAVQKRLTRTLKSDADEVGRKIGEQSARSFVDGVRVLFQGMAGSGGGGATGGGRVWNASYGPGRQSRVASGPGRRAQAGARRMGGAFNGNSMLDLIGSAEGTDKGRGYNETLAYGAFTGGNVNLTGMTLDQIDALQTRMLRHPGNKWNSSAVGRYQFVRTRLRDLRRRYKLPGSAVFNKQMQDALGRASLSERGGSLGSLRNEWEGLRRVPDNVLRDAMRRDRQRKQKAQRIEGSASLDVRFPNGVPAGTKVAAKANGLFQSVHLDTGRTMKPAAA